MNKSYSNKLRKSVNNRRYKQSKRKKYRKKNNRRYNKLSKNTKYLGGSSTVPTEITVPTEFTVAGVGSIDNAFKVYLQGKGNELEDVNIKTLSSNTGKSGAGQYSATSSGTSLFIKYIPKGLRNKGIFEFTKHTELTQILASELRRATKEAAAARQRDPTLKLLLGNNEILSKRYIPIIDIAWVLQYTTGNRRGNWIVVKADEKADSSGRKMVEKREDAKIMGIALIQLDVMYPKSAVEPLRPDIQRFMKNLLEVPDNLKNWLTPGTRGKVVNRRSERTRGEQLLVQLKAFTEPELTNPTQLLFIDGKGTPASESYLEGDRFREGEIFLGCMGAKLAIDMDKMTRDVSFLKQHDIMDYSLNMCVTCDGLHVNSSNIVQESTVDDLSDIFKKTIIVALKSIQILKPGDSANCLRIFNEVMKSMKSLFPEDFYSLNQKYGGVLEKISLELWDTKYSAILNILGLPTPFMNKEYRQTLEQAMDQVLENPQSKVLELIIPPPVLKGGATRTSRLLSTSGIRETGTVGSSTPLTIDLQKLGSLPTLYFPTPELTTPARYFKEEFLKKIPHVEIKFKPGDVGIRTDPTRGYKLSLIDISLSRVRWTHADFVKSRESNIKWTLKRNGVPGMERAGCKNLTVTTVNGDLPINPRCNPCSVSVCNAEDYAIRFLNWVHKISIPGNTEAVVGTPTTVVGIPTTEVVSHEEGGGQGLRGGQRRLTKKKKSNRRNKTIQKRKRKKRLNKNKR